MRHRRVVVGLFALVSGLIWTFAPARATAPTAEEDGFAARVAAERSAAGRPAYASAGDLVEVARRHAQRMASEDRLYHNPSMSSEVQDWEAVGENVGVGASVDDIHRSFMASSTHRQLILSTRFTQIGIGVAVGADGRLWVTQVFRRPAASGAAGAAAPAPAPASAAKPAPRPVASPRPAPAAVDQAAAAARAARQAEADAAARAAAETAARLEAEAAEAAAVADRLAADLAVGPSAIAAPAVLGTVAVASEGDAPSARQVTLPIGVATSLLLAVVLGLLAEVGRYALSDWRRQRNQASMSSSRSPSSTAWTFPVS